MHKCQIVAQSCKISVSVNEKQRQKHCVKRNKTHTHGFRRKNELKVLKKENVLRVHLCQFGQVCPYNKDEVVLVHMFVKTGMST